MHMLGLLAALVAVCLLHTTESAKAQSDPPAAASGGIVLDPIVVDAERRSEELARVPVSATVIDRDTLERANLKDLRDVAALTPNLTLTTNASRTNPNFFIRGIGSIATVDPGATQAVATYVDGVYVPFPSTAIFDFLDIERVEVLRGPQGTLYGRNATAGAINIITRNPEPSFGGTAKLEGGSSDLLRGVGTVNVPLSDGLGGFRVSVLGSSRDGYVENTLNDNLDSEQTGAIRGRFQLTPTDRLTIDLSGSHEQIRDSGYAYVPFDRAFARRYDTPLDSTDDRDATNASLRVRYAFDQFDLVSTTAYQHYDADTANPQDLLFGLPREDLGFTFSTEQETGTSWSQEFLAQSAPGGRLDWTAGVFLSHTDVEIDFGSTFTPASGFPFGFRTSGSPTQNVTDVAAIFADATYAMTDRLFLTAGGRYSWEWLDWTTSSSINGVTVPGSRAERSTSFSAFTPRFVLEYQPTEAVLTYASVSRGFKAGGFTIFNAGDPPTDYDPEFVWTYEAGAKYQSSDRRFFLGAAAFYNDWSDLQVFYLTTVAGTTRRLVANAESARTFGAEVEAKWRLGDRFEFGGSLGWTNARLTNVINPLDGSSLSSNRVPLSSEWTAGLRTQYSAPVGNGVQLRLRADLTYTGPFYFDTLNRQRQDGVTLLNLTAAVEADRWSVGAQVRNALDQDYYRWRFDSIGRDFAAAAEPLTASAFLRISF
ncbi:MAG: TonB-dependent receptor [Pseudomonadota bacterium]